MKVGIVGLPRSGKTTVFAALTGQTPDPGLPPGRTTLGTVRVQDERLRRLHALYPPAKLIFAETVFSDITGAAGKKGVDRSTLTAMKELDAFAQVLRGFPDDAGEAPEPLRELRDLEAETILADLDVVERKVARLAKGEKPSFPTEKDVLGKLKEALDANLPARRAGLTAEQIRNLSGYAFLSLKPVLCGTELGIVQEGIPDVIPVEMCYLGWQESLELLAKPEYPEPAWFLISPSAAILTML